MKDFKLVGGMVISDNCHLQLYVKFGFDSFELDFDLYKSELDYIVSNIAELELGKMYSYKGVDFFIVKEDRQNRYLPDKMLLPKFKRDLDRLKGKGFDLSMFEEAYKEMEESVKQAERTALKGKNVL